MNPIFKKLNFKDQKVLHIVNAPESFSQDSNEMLSLAAIKNSHKHLLLPVVPLTLIYGSIPRINKGTGGFVLPCLITLCISFSYHGGPDDISNCIFFVGTISIPMLIICPL